MTTKKPVVKITITKKPVEPKKKRRGWNVA